MFVIIASPDILHSNFKQTEVFFVPETEVSATGSPAHRDPIVITQNVDASVTSSTMSGDVEGLYSDEEDEDSDDFCMIEDAAWGKSVSL